MSRELKQYRIRATCRPAKNALLSSTVVVRNEEGQAGYCYINFDAPLVEKVGKALCRGLSKDDPAYLKVVFYARTQVWLVQAEYTARDHTTLLWKTKVKPDWLNFYRVRKPKCL